MQISKNEAMYYAGLVNQKAIALGFDTAKPGVSLAEIDLAMEQFIRDNNCIPAFKGYQPPGASSPFPATACISPNEVAVHGVPGNYVLKSGDLLTIDVGTEFKGYYVDAARSRVVDWWNASTYPKDAIRLVDATEHVMDAQLELVRDGCTFLELTEVSEKVAAEYQVNILPQWGGHYIGSSIHMGPFIPSCVDRRKSPLQQQLEISKLKKLRLKSGDCICLEPVVSIGSVNCVLESDGWTVRQVDNMLTAHTERCLLVKDSGYEMLS